MRKSLLAFGVAVVIAAPSLAHADCNGRRTAGTVIGAVAGGIIGSSASHGGGAGTLLGAGVGALAGHEIAGAGCRDYGRYRRAEYRHGRYWARPRYDAYDGRAEGYGSPPAYPVRCEMRDQAFYDERGELIRRPAEVCR